MSVMKNQVDYRKRKERIKMYILNVEKRELNKKAKAIRKNGKIPYNISEGKADETVMIQIPEGEGKRLLKNKGRGGKVLLQCDGEEYRVLIKDAVINHLEDRIETITFQRWEEKEYVNSLERSCNA